MSIAISNGTKDIVVTFQNDKGIPNAETITIPATASATQADYVVLTNAYGDTIACWLDIDADGTAPTGAAYVAADSTLKISIVTGGTTADNGTIFAEALTAEAWSAITTIVDNLDGSVTITQNIGAVVDAAVPKDADDSGAGSITATTDTTGAATKTVRVDYYPKGLIEIVADYPRNEVIFNRGIDFVAKKSRASLAIKFTDVASPATADLTALVTQIKTWEAA